MIHLLDSDEQIVDVLVNPSPNQWYNQSNVTEDVDNSLLSLAFTTPYQIDSSKISKVIAQDQDRQHRLFLISSIDDKDDNGLLKTIQCDGDHYALGFERPIPPTTLTGVTLREAAEFILQDTTYQLGQVDFDGIKDVVFKDFIFPLAALQQIKDQFGCVLKFRVEIIGKTITRFLDLLEPSDDFSGKQLNIDKDITGLDRQEDRDNIITRMIGYAYDADGHLVTFEDVNGGKNYIESAEAFAKWNNKGRHRYGVHQYQPEDGGDIDKQKMLAATREAFSLVNDATVAYQVTAAALEQIEGYKHEKIRVGMNVRIRDDHFTPSLLLTAQVKQTEMPELDDPSGDFVYQFGDYKLIDLKQEQQVADLQSQVGRRSPVWDGSGAKADAAQQAADDASQAANDAKESADNATQQVINLGTAVDGKSTILASHTEPTDTTSFWIDTSETLNVLKHFDMATGQWVKASATDFIDLGGQVVGDQIAPKAVTFDKISVMELSAIVANLGEVNAGILNGVTINGATIQSIIDAKNFLQIVGNHLHIEGENASKFIYNIIDTVLGQLVIEFGGIDSNGNRFPVGQTKFTELGLAVMTTGNTNQGIILNPQSVKVIFGDRPDGNNPSFGPDGAESGGGLDMNVFTTGSGAFRVRHGATYADGYFNTLFTTAFEANPNSTANNIYTRPKSGGIHLVTLAGTTNVLMEIRAARFTMSSHEKFKTNITPWTDSVWDAIKSTGLYSYNLKDDLSQGINFKHYGVIFGEGYGAPSMVSLPDGEHLDEHNYTSLTLKGVQELMFKVDEQQEQIDDLTKRLEALEGQTSGN